LYLCRSPCVSMLNFMHYFGQEIFVWYFEPSIFSSVLCVKQCICIIIWIWGGDFLFIYFNLKCERNKAPNNITAMQWNIIESINRWTIKRETSSNNRNVDNVAYLFLSILIIIYSCDREFYVKIRVWIMCYTRAHIVGHETHLSGLEKNRKSKIKFKILVFIIYYMRRVLHVHAY
jgi:hypothetical protein